MKNISDGGGWDGEVTKFNHLLKVTSFGARLSKSEVKVSEKDCIPSSYALHARCSVEKGFITDTCSCSKPRPWLKMEWP